VFGFLIVMTLITVGSSYIDFGGSTNIMIAMVIATAKALSVILFFMGLRWQGQENNATFFCSFVFLAIFLGLTGADIFYRRELTPVKVDASEMGGGGGSVDFSKLAKPTPELMGKGKALFGQQCIACHGADGKGDGPAAAALNPKPRNFTAGEGWKNGRGLPDILKTLTNGLGSMPAFSAISIEDRAALAHYVRSLGPVAPDATPDQLAALQKEFGAGAKPRLSIDTAIDKVSREWEASHGKSDDSALDE
jgi:caa(3)-type oxidase subunit IV